MDEKIAIGLEDIYCNSEIDGSGENVQNAYDEAEQMKKKMAIGSIDDKDGNMTENIENGLEDEYWDTEVARSEENYQNTNEKTKAVKEYEQLSFPLQESQPRDYETITLKRKKLGRKNTTKFIVGAVCFGVIQIVVASVIATSLKFIFIDNLQQDLKELQQYINDYQLDIKNLQQGMKDSQQYINDSQVDIKNLQQGMKDSQPYINDSQLDIKNLQQGMKDSQQYINDSQLDIKNMQQGMKDSQQNIQNLQQEIPQIHIDTNYSFDVLNSEISLLKTSISQQEEMIYKLNKTLANIAVGLALQDFMFDRSTLHENVYISKDNRAIYNSRSKSELDQGSGPDRSVIGTIKFSQYEIIYYELDVYFKPLFEFRKDTMNEMHWVICEFGFSTNDNLDVYPPHHIQKDYFLIIAEYNSINESFDLHLRIGANDSMKLTDGTLTTKYKKTFAFYVNGPKKQIICYERQDNDLVKLFLFTNLDFAKRIHPVFYMQSRVFLNFKVILSLKTGKFIKSFPKQLYEV